MGLCLLAVALAAGFRAWLLTVALSPAVVVAVPYAIPPGVEWAADEFPPAPLILDDPAAPRLARLRRDYRLDIVTGDAATDAEHVVRLAAWTSTRFRQVPTIARRAPTRLRSSGRAREASASGALSKASFSPLRRARSECPRESSASRGRA